MADKPTINVRLHFRDGRKPATLDGVDPDVTRLVIPGSPLTFTATNEIDAEGYVIYREEPRDS